MQKEAKKKDREAKPGRHQVVPRAKAIKEERNRPDKDGTKPKKSRFQAGNGFSIVARFYFGRVGFTKYAGR